MKFIDDSVPYARPLWHTASRSSPALTLHVLYRQVAQDVVCVGIESKEFDHPFAESIVEAVESLPVGSFTGDFGVIPAPSLPKGALGYLAGQMRRLASGWSNDQHFTTVHVFPCASSELSGTWEPARFLTVMQSLRVLRPDRPVQPFFEVQLLSRGPSKLAIPSWSYVPLSQVLVYAGILSSELNSELKIRNISGRVLAFATRKDWGEFEQKIAAHANGA